MTSILDQMVTAGIEATYGTAAVGTRGVFTSVDGWQDEVQVIEVDGARAGREAMTPSQTLHVPTGGTGRIEAGFGVDGMSLLCKHLLNTGSAAAVTDTTGKKFTMESSPDGPAASYTFWVRRVASDGKKHSTVYAGAVPTGWTLTQAMGAALSLAVDYDFAVSSTQVGGSPTGEPTPVYSAGRYFSWQDLVVTAGSARLGTVTNLEISVDNNLDSDRRYLKGSTVKSMPIRQGVPTLGGTIAVHLDDGSKALVDAWVRGTPVKLAAAWTAADVNIATSPNTKTVRPSLTVTFPLVKYTGSTPQMSLDSLTEVSLPFSAVMPTAGHAMTVDIVASDTAFA